jgi:hypothetical protein
LAAFGVDLAVAGEQCSWCQPHRHSLNAEEPTMTATITARPPSDSLAEGRRRGGSDDSLLRFAMRADATLCAGAGLLVAMAADPLSRLSGLSAASEWLAGAALVVCGVALYVLAAAPAIRRVGVGIVVANVVFAVLAIGVLVAGVLPLTGAGVAMMLATTAATLGLAYLQYLGVRRLA